MRRPHDMGGRFGDGAVIPAPDGMAGYEAPWQRTALGLTLAAGGLGAWSIDAARHARECLDPADYARFAYYEKWLAALADLLVAKDLVTRAELANGGAAPQPLSDRAWRAANVTPVLARGTPFARAGCAPAFHVGDLVRSRAAPENAFVPGGHTRLPLYAADKTGRIVLRHGRHVFPDKNAHGLGEAPEPLYTVAFRAADLWEHPENPADDVTVDLWESYLQPA